MKLILSLLGIFVGFALMIEASESVKLALLDQNNTVHFLIVITIGVMTACYWHFVRKLATGNVMTWVVFTGFSAMVYLTIFSGLYAENLTRGIGGHMIGYAFVYSSRFFYLVWDEDRTQPRTTMVRD